MAVRLRQTNVPLLNKIEIEDITTGLWKFMAREYKRQRGFYYSTIQ